MANFCLIPSEVDRFKQALVSGEINPDKLAAMSSEERHAAMAAIVGDANAQGVNALFESKLLLKNQKAGMISWAKQVANLKPEVRRDLIAKIERLDHVLDPKGDPFLQDLANTKLGYSVTEAEAKKIAALSEKVSQARAAVTPDMPAGHPTRLKLGEAIHDLNVYTGELKHPSYTVGEALKNPGGFVKDKAAEVAAHPGRAVTKTMGLTKSLKAALDLSATFRQGYKTMITNPTLWAKNVAKSIGDAARGFKNEDVMRAINADVLSRPNFDLYRRAGLAVSTIEEAFPSSAPEKVPLLGRAFKASEGAYTGFLHRQRADLFDKYLEIAEKNGVNIKDVEQLKPIAKLVNSLTGRGHLGGLEPAANTVNSMFFSPRALKANIDTLTAHQFQKNITPFARKEAAKSTLKVIGGTAAILGFANAVAPGSVELDPRSADFGKIRIGNTRFDVTAGMSSILTLAARLLSQSSKSSTTGSVSKLGTGYGQTSAVDLITQFLENKLSPSAALIRDLMQGEDFSGNKLTLAGELKNTFVPLPITTYQELKSDPNAANALVGLIADGLGISTNTYGKGNKDWTKNPTKETTQLMQRLGSEESQKAMKLYNDTYDQYLKDRPDAFNVKKDRSQIIDDAKNYAQAVVYKKYNYKGYEPTEAEKAASRDKNRRTREKKKSGQ